MSDDSCLWMFFFTASPDVSIMWHFHLHITFFSCKMMNATK